MAHKHHRGSALISALFIMTLVAIAAVAMSARLQQDIYRARLVLTTDELYLASEAVTFWAMGVIKKQPVVTQSLNSKRNPYEYPLKHANDYPGITTSGQILDLQARFNVNQLIESPGTKNTDNTATPADFFLQLLNQVATESPPDRNDAIVKATTHWVNAAPSGQGQDELTRYYLEQTPPYSPAHQAMASVSEFRLVKGVDDALYQAMKPFITALPESTPININTAPLTVLMALGSGLSKTEANAFIELREKKQISNLSEINELLTKLNIPIKQITLESTYFLSIGTVRTQDRTLIHYTILKRNKEPNGKISVHIIRDSLNDL